MTLEQFEARLKVMQESGEVSFTFESKYKRGFYKSIQRLNNLERLMAKDYSYLVKALVNFYGMYVGVRQIWLTAASKELEEALLFYQGAWKHMASYKGEYKGEDRVKVTYYGRA